MKRLTYVLIALCTLILTPSAINQLYVSQPIKVADPEPGYLCKVCPKCCKKKDLEEESPKPASDTQLS